MDIPKQRHPYVVFVIIAAVFIFAVFALILRKTPKNNITGIQNIETKVLKFQSEAEFKNYLQKAANISSGFKGLGGAPETAMNLAADAVATPDRVSQTNVQVKGIDEPDIVKTDGKNIFISSEFGGFYPLRGGIATDSLIYPPSFPQAQTQIINAFPAESLAKSGKIDSSGEMLVFGKILVVLGNNKLTGFNLTDPANPKEVWSLDFDNNYLQSARARNGELLVVMQNSLNISSPCPIPLFKTSSTSITVPCQDIYHPITSVPTDTTYTVSKIDPEVGEVKSKTSFIGSSGMSIVYVSNSWAYITYTYPGDFLAFFSRFIEEKASDLMPGSIVLRLNQINSYDISSQSKLTELELVLNQYKTSLTQDQQLKLENELNNRMKDYLAIHVRDLQTTGIAKINLDNFSVSATGAVAGAPLNQFSLDEYGNHLRIATTVSNNFWWFGFGGNGTDSANDLYILDQNLNQTGAIKDLGLGERIYSARFIGNRGYLVTFKQVDPFFVFDLSDPANPRKTGELKIPGYSSYLHPLTQSTILGVGQENGQVKLSLFDVSNASMPLEIDKFNLNEYWTEVSNNHHAFLQDEKHSVFFIPGGNGGYIFSYVGNKLTLVNAISTPNAKRALYINDFLYVISDSEILVFDQNTWGQINKLGL